jgi:Cu/Ag efflux pump CusA
MAAITMVFEKGTPLFRARQVAQERMTELFMLPGVSSQITLVNPVSSAGRAMAIGLTSDNLSLIEMSVLARWTIVPKLMGLSGVANVAIWGERERQLQVQVDPAKLKAEGISLHQIISTAGNSLWASPLTFLEASTPGTGGWIETPNQRLGVRHILPIRTAEHLAQVPIDDAGSKRLGDVATVVEDHQPLIGDAFVDDAPSLMLVVEKFPWANTTNVTKQVEEALVALQPAVSGLQMDPTLYRPATFIESAVGNLRMTLAIGALLATIGLFAFYFNWRTAFISTVAIVVSVIAAAGVLYVRGATFNLVIIAGLMIALSAIIANAVGDIENISRRLRQAKEDGNGKSTTRTIFDAVVETRTPILYAAVIMFLAVTPFLFLEGVSGAFFQPLATSYMLALLASVAVAMTVTPALSMMFLRNASLTGGESPVTALLRGMHKAIFGLTLRTPAVAFGLVIAIIVVGLASLPFVRQETLLPVFKETDLVVSLAGSPGASHPAMSRVTTLASQELRSIPGVRNVSAHVGRAIMSDKFTNIHSGELWVSIDPAADYETTVSAVKKTVGGYPGLSPEVLTNLQAKLRDELSGTDEALVVRVYGEDMDQIRKKAEEVQRAIARVDGITQAKVQYPEEMPSLEIEVDIEKAKRYGLKPGDIRRAATSLVSGIEVGSLFEAQKVFKVVVLGTPDTRESITAIEELLIDTPSGGHARLKDVAHISIAPTATQINRDAVARRIDVAASVNGRDLAAIAGDVNRAIEHIEFPLEYRAELLGEYAERLAAQQRVTTFSIAAAILIFLTLQVYFRSWRLATVFCASLPAALVGGLLVMLATGGQLSFGSIIGFVAVLGIAIHSGISLYSHYLRLEDEEGESFGRELVERGTQERFAPIAMTIGTTALAFLPVAFLGGSAGLEIAFPMATVILGGLVTTALISLFVLPALYLRFQTGRDERPDHDIIIVDEAVEETMDRTAKETN